jgi:seryl-tRNA synthetase
MIDPRLLREKPEVVRAALRNRGINFPLDELLSIDVERRGVMTKLQQLRHQRNLVSSRIAEARRAGRDASDYLLEMKSVSDEISRLEDQERELEARFRELMLRLPNIPHESVPVGRDESDNVVVKTWGKPREFGFKPKDHIELGLAMGFMDVERAARAAGARFYYLVGDIVKLQLALLNFALDQLRSRGFISMLTPYMLRREAMEGAVILPAFEDTIYKVEGEDLYLIGTAEHAILAYHMGEILEGDGLPLRYAGISPCFRKEAGAHGRDTKGIFRVHQFDKVEQFVFSRPEDSWAEHELLLQSLEDIFQKLGVPYRVMNLCTADLGGTAAKTYDLEAWLPGQGKYREMASCSNCTDYQARRLKIRFRDRPNEEPRLVHTLNSTALASTRALIAIVENYQTGEGMVDIPQVLHPYLGGMSRLEPLNPR